MTVADLIETLSHESQGALVVVYNKETGEIKGNVVVAEKSVKLVVDYYGHLEFRLLGDLGKCDAGEMSVVMIYPYA
jgi:hypothetical protein